MKSLVNNVSLLNQQVYNENLKKIRPKPYHEFFKSDMYLNDDIIRLSQSGSIEKELITHPTPEDFNQMLQSELWKNTGYDVLEDGTLYIASLTQFPNCTAEMFEWWFWWHSVESERYALWYPYCHVSAEATNKDVLGDESLEHRQKYIGNTHIITEYLNEVKNDIAISFIEPEQLGFDSKILKEQGVTASACGHVYLQKPRAKVCTMVHLFKENDTGGKLISRYYLGHEMQLLIGNIKLKLPSFLKNKLLAGKSTGMQIAYEQLMHDQIEFTHLASFLPELYHKFGK